MDKRYQVFVSSTFEDLREERQEIMHALLELDCIPSGMELFSAASEDQWTLIQKVISECDYYLVVSAGRYGSIGPDGYSYTEMEYRYAVQLGKPVIGFMHKDPMQLSAARSEQTEDGKKKLQEFRALIQTRMCKFWENPSELGSVVSRSLVRLIKTTPAIGWVRSDQPFDMESTAEILKLKKTIETLEQKLEQVRMSAPLGSDQLAQGDTTFEISYAFKTRDPNVYGSRQTWELAVDITWNQIFYDIGPVMLNEAADHDLRETLNRSVRQRSLKFRRVDKRFAGLSVDTGSFSVSDHDFQTIKIQLLALGLITKSQKARSVKDTGTFWSLTPYGDQKLTQLRAIRNESSSNFDEVSELLEE